ncbi:tetratricopeptide repeat protein [Parabacteroides sp. PF5-9]|uniref:tetratricopeptide repeat protein n=1 Tax=Parabacteroides sp. PF5-9 TaxID=1742404 RepID=UPI0024762419|nr:tetratricopeptide repeat protein [Parabacteroides sp. PF5-9]MDH6357098.1 tetratricopeptide (TPR) repeat protein [Parabacteroides sp. PF5-9]
MRRSRWIYCFCIVVFLGGGHQVGFAQTYEELVERSYTFVEQEDWFSAEESLKAAMRNEPGNPTNYALLTNLGTIQRRQGKRAEALISYTAALSRQPQNATILENRASLYVEMGETDKALADYTLLLLYEPDHQEALYYRGLVYLQKKDFLAAEADFDQLLQANERSIRGRLGHAILEKMRGNYEDSERIYNYLISEQPRDWLLYEGRADLYFMMGKNARAMADVNKAFAESEPSASLYVLRGKIKLAQYEKASAINDFEKAQEMGYDQAVIDELMKMAK